MMVDILCVLCLICLIISANHCDALRASQSIATYHHQHFKSTTTTETTRTRSLLQQATQYSGLQSSRIRQLRIAPTSLGARRQFYDDDDDDNFFNDKKKENHNVHNHYQEEDFSPQEDPLTGKIQYPHGMTKRLYEIAQQLRRVPMDSIRYQELFHYANMAQPMDNTLKTPANKVLGCQSTVYVHCVAKKEEIIVDNTKVLQDAPSHPPTTEPQLRLYFSADSDSMLTKGLVSLLVQGLSGYTLEEIAAVKPEFIRYAGIEQSLTPGRNSGFLNMLNTMKNQAATAIATYICTNSNS